MLARVIIKTENGYLSHEVLSVSLIAFMAARGFTFRGLTDNQRQREELRGHPKFSGINGPMWDGDAIRYECPESYQDLSS